jgi:aminoglycoside phosphotransferase (APT) family kinase protein
MGAAGGPVSDAEVVDDLANPARLQGWLAAHLDVARRDAPVVIRRARGSSNEMFEVRADGQRWMLRRPTKIALERAGSGIAREYRLLTALEGTRAPHPRPVAFCDDEAVIGSPFYLMDLVDGFEPIDPLPKAFLTDAEARHGIGIALIDALGELSEVDWQGRGLGDFGKPDGFHQRQVRRWRSQLESYRWRDLPHVEEIEAWLSANQPAGFVPGIMHGDYHQGNVLMARDLPARVAAVVDWENATIGDPLLDVGYFLTGWPDPGETRRLGTRIDDRRALATKAELVAHYEARTGRQVSSLSYYMVLSLYKLGVMLEGIAARGQALGRDVAGTARYVESLFMEADRLALAGS